MRLAVPYFPIAVRRSIATQLRHCIVQFILFSAAARRQATPPSHGHLFPCVYSQKFYSDISVFHSFATLSSALTLVLVFVRGDSMFQLYNHCWIANFAIKI